MGAFVSGTGERGDEFGEAAVELRPPLAAGLVGEGAGNEGLSRSGCPAQDQVEDPADPVAGGELDEGCPCDSAPGDALPAGRCKTSY